jgi:type IV fimbrial biogenesis protein FimT
LGIRYAKKLVMKQQAITIRGFTLVELMITLAVAAVLLTVAVPSFQAVFQNNRLVSQVNELVTAINLARNEAIKRGVNVTLRAETGGFQNGWCVNLLGGGCSNNDIRRFQSMDQMSVTSSVTSVSFDARGAKSAPAAVVTITLQPDGCVSGTVDRLRTISIANTGRALVTSGNCP